ncbi:MAG: dCTP deaminase [Acidimicrobiia bacterium]
MKLTGTEIDQRVRNGDIGIEPFDPGFVSSNSYDLRLAPTLEYYTQATLDARGHNPTAETTIPEEGFVLPAGTLWIGRSVERVTSPKFVQVLHAKSGIARLGLHVHITADLIAPGHDGHIEFHLAPTVDVRVYPNQPIAQLSFELPLGNVVTRDRSQTWSADRAAQANANRGEFTR